MDRSAHASLMLEGLLDGAQDAKAGARLRSERPTSEQFYGRFRASALDNPGEACGSRFGVWLTCQQTDLRTGHGHSSQQRLPPQRSLTFRNARSSSGGQLPRCSAYDRRFNPIAAKDGRFNPAQHDMALPRSAGSLQGCLKGGQPADVPR